MVPLVLLAEQQEGHPACKKSVTTVCYWGTQRSVGNLEKLAGYTTSTKGTMDPEGSACNSCNSRPLYAR